MAKRGTTKTGHGFRMDEAHISIRKDLTIKEKRAMGWVPVIVDGQMEWLTPMQEIFCHEYVRNPSQPTKAAWASGYGANAKTDFQRLRYCRSMQYKLRMYKKVMIRCKELVEKSKQGLKTND